ncbi:UNVERIFIED_CONTAM: hypothetical protein Slati_3000700 [Sesamum latifolium]|uniref:Uncharacterized protein n=1 Tax=Sesamum latifolium TaxID=2727402 RepID=A0AAW2VET4_9LAMI
MTQGLCNGDLADSLVGEPAATWDDLLARAKKFILIEESRRIKSVHRKQILREQPKRSPIMERRREEPKRRPDYHTPLRVTRTKALSIAEKNGNVRWPLKMRDNEERQKSRKYCRFHQDRGHDMEECFHLQRELERLIQLGYLPEELYYPPRKTPRKIDRGGGQPQKEEGCQTTPNKSWTEGRIIHLIEGGEYGGVTRISRKRHLRN